MKKQYRTALSNRRHQHAFFVTKTNADFKQVRDRVRVKDRRISLRINLRERVIGGFAQGGF